MAGETVGSTATDDGGQPRPARPPSPVREGGGAYERGPDGRWRLAVDDVPVAGARDLALGDLFQPELGEVDGVAVRLVPRPWASRHPEHPLAWAFEYADLGGRGPIPVPADEWEARSTQVVAMSAPALHPWNLVGTDGVAAILGVSEATVRAYLARRQMPEPLVRIGRTPVWPRQQIEAWHAARPRARSTVHPPRPAPEPDDGTDDHDTSGGGDAGSTVSGGLVPDP